MPIARRSGLGCAAALAALLLAGGAAPAEEQLVDGIAAQVGPRIVLVSEVLEAVAPQEQAMREAGAPESEIAKLRAAALERLIEERLLEGLVEEAELDVSDEEVTRTIEGIARENGLSLEQLYASVVFHGLTVEEYRGQIERELERRRLVQGVVGAEVKVEEAEVEALYRERFGSQPEGGVAVRVRQILRAYGGSGGGDREEACAEVRAAQRRVVEGGEGFAKVASEVSEVAPRQGGDIGWLHLDSAAAWMAEALAGLEPGDVSEVLVLPFGCSLLELVDRREYEPVGFEQAREPLARELFERGLEERYRAWMEELRAERYIARRGYFADAAGLGAPAFPREARETPEAPPTDLP